jgi:hypothetical protein
VTTFMISDLQFVSNSLQLPLLNLQPQNPGGKQNEMEPMTKLLGRNLSQASFCASCLHVLRRQIRSNVTRASISQRQHMNIAQPGEQASPLSGYYEALLNNSVLKSHMAQNQRPSTPKDTIPGSTTQTDREAVEAKARIVFGSRLAGPLVHKAAKDRQSTNIAGILVPPRPSEPDNCCMSGCVNCVWDLYREDLEEWAAKASEAQRKLRRQEKETGAASERLRTFTGGSTSSAVIPVGAAASMDDDGGGSETNWSLDLDKAGSPKLGEDLFASIPIGIREYMRTEKMLKERHAQEPRAE